MDVYLGWQCDSELDLGDLVPGYQKLILLFVSSTRNSSKEPKKLWQIWTSWWS